MAGPSDVFDHPRFVGLWTYRAYGSARKFCASVMVAGTVQETEMCPTWPEAVDGARRILDETE